MAPISLSDSIFIAGHKGLVGGAVLRNMQKRGFHNFILKDRKELDLRNQQAVHSFFEKNRPQHVIMAAAKVGGIHANDTLRGDFIMENIEIQSAVICAAFKYGVEKFVFLGSSCIYPKMAPQPIPESALLTGSLEPTNDAYAVAKIAGLMTTKSIKMQYGRRFISVMPTNVYGPGDRYDSEGSHVLPALLMRFHQAKVQNKPVVDAWGTGKPLREFIHCDDLADAIVHCFLNYEDAEHINLGTGQEVSIRELTELVKEVVGFKGEINWDASKPDGTPRKLMDSSKLLATGWKPQVQLKAGLKSAYEDYLKRFG